MVTNVQILVPTWIIVIPNIGKAYVTADDDGIPSEMDEGEHLPL